MSCKLIAINDKPNTNAKKQYICESEEEIKLLPRYGIEGSFVDPNDTICNEPCAIGSTALVRPIDTSKPTLIFILTPSNEWVKL